MKRSYRDILAFINTASKWIEAHKDDSKFKYALHKLVKKLTKAMEAYQEAFEDLNVDHCAVNKDGHILREANGSYVFTKDEQRAVAKARRALFETLVDVTPHMATDVPTDLTYAERDAFAGFVLPDEAEDADAAPVAAKNAA